MKINYPNSIIPDSRDFKKGRTAGRRGVLVAAVLVVLILISMLCGGLLRQALARRGQERMDERRLQADWLAESALDRAAARLAEQGDYQGETWEVPAEEFGGVWGASVRIEVEAVADQPERRRVKVRAEYPAGSETALRRSKQAIISGIFQNQEQGNPQ